jgi:C-terminal processing protease CtpA/Prc
MVVPLLFASCGEDRWPAYAAQTRTGIWIDSVMRQWYYRYRELPSEKSVNYFLEPAAFFKSILPKDDKFSYIDSLKAVTRSLADIYDSYGIEFSMSDKKINDTAYYARVLYVAKGSPADVAGLKRTDRIVSVNGIPITQKTYSRLYSGGSVTLKTAYYDAVKDSIIPNDEPMQMAASRSIEDDPVYYQHVYERGDKRIGYLVYNHFSFGPTDDPAQHPYDDELLAASNYFASQQVNEFVLDLRYNNGGYISSAELLCTLLAPASALGEKLGYAVFNDRFPQPTVYTLDPSRIAGGTNLNLNRLFVLTSSQTASASELLINCLKPYMSEIVVIGQRTVGKNVGSNAFSNPALQVIMHPIVCTLYNSQDKSDYTNGFQPDYPATEDAQLAKFLPFGDEQEQLLSIALSVIDGTYGQTGGGGETRAASRQLVNSLDRRAHGGVKMK